MGLRLTRGSAWGLGWHAEELWSSGSPCRARGAWAWLRPPYRSIPAMWELCRPKTGAG